jgi:hypothetical protein
MNTENIDFNIEALKARITVLEDFIKAKHPDFPTTPKGTSGTMTGDEHSHGDEPDIIGSIRPLEIWDFVNVRPTPSVMVKPLYQVMRRESVEIVDITDDLDGTRHDNGDLYKWYKVKDATFVNGKGGGYVREDVVTFSKERPENPATPFNGIWLPPVSHYKVTNTHENERSHDGTDFACPLGTPVLCGPNGGYVVKAFDCKVCNPKGDGASSLNDPNKAYGYGSNVILRFRNDLLPQTLKAAIPENAFVFAMYAHLSKVNVSQGQLLAPYQIIGEVGMTGNVYSIGGGSPAHLHFALRYSLNANEQWPNMNHNRINPSLLVKA